MFFINILDYCMIFYLLLLNKIEFLITIIKIYLFINIFRYIKKFEKIVKN